MSRPWPNPNPILKPNPNPYLILFKKFQIAHEPSRNSSAGVAQPAPQPAQGQLDPTLGIFSMQKGGGAAIPAALSQV